MKGKISGYSDLIELVAGRENQNPPPLAKSLHDWHYIYVIYAAFDGWSLLYSMIKYIFDILSENPADDMHKWLMDPVGALTAVTSSAALISFLMLSNHFRDDDQNLIKRYIAILGPYLRDFLKAPKNSMKATFSSFRLVELLSGQNLNFLFVPVGLVLGGLSIANRIWYRQMVTERISMMGENANLLKKIQDDSDIKLSNIDDILKDIRKQTDRQKRLGLLSAAYGGLVDGLYLYVGVLGLASVSPPILIMLVIFSSIYLLASIATRIYEEYDYQRKLQIAQAKIELAHSGKKIELMFKELQHIHAQIILHERELADTSNIVLSEKPQEKLQKAQKELAKHFIGTMVLFEENRKKFLEVSTLSYASAVLAGAKSGLYAYSALASAVFAVATIHVLLAMSFPPALLIASVCLGLLLLVTFITHSVISTYWHRCKIEERLEEEKRLSLEPIQVENPNKITLGRIKQLCETSKNDISKLKPEEVSTAIRYGMWLDPTPQFFFEEWFEVVRSFLSGVRKGDKAIVLLLNSFEVSDDKGHYHESRFMMGFIVISAFIHMIIFGLRAYARMGRDAPEKPFLQVPRHCEQTSFETSLYGDEIQSNSANQSELNSTFNSEQNSVSIVSFFKSFSKNICSGGKNTTEVKVAIRRKSPPEVSLHTVPDLNSGHYTF